MRLFYSQRFAHTRNREIKAAKKTQQIIRTESIRVS
jgi:hypothetical protein